MYMDRFDDPRMAVYHVLYARTSGCRVVLGFRPQSMLKTNALLILQLIATQARNRLTVRASLNFNAALCHPYTSRLRAFGRIKMVAKMKDDLVGDDGFIRMRVSSLRCASQCNVSVFTSYDELQAKTGGIESPRAIVEIA